MPMRILAIGAHPDDCEFKCGGVAALWSNLGHTVCFLSVTNGQSGHHELSASALVQRRTAEAARAAALIGIESRILPLPDGLLEPTLQNRLLLIRIIREFNPDLIITNRPNDYHPDHRYTSQLVQDSAFMLTVPQVAPESPALRANPVILYWSDPFQKPLPFHCDIAIDIDSVFDKKLAMLHQHESQMYEWLPWLEGTLSQIPKDDPSRLAYLKQWYPRHNLPPTDAFRAAIMARYGAQRGATIQHAEAFEVSEYGTPLDAQATGRLFSGL